MYTTKNEFSNVHFKNIQHYKQVMMCYCKSIQINKQMYFLS